MRELYLKLAKSMRDGDDTAIVTTLSPSGISKTLRDWPVDVPAGEYNGQDSIYVKKNGDELVIVERFLPRPRLIIFGGGHVAVPLSQIASILKFDITVFDDRPFFASKERFREAKDVICDGFGNMAGRIVIRPHDSVVIVTRGHKYDHQCLRFILDGKPPHYLGMIGSKRRAAIVRSQIAEEGYAPELLRRLHSPIGLAIGAVTPEEIAVSILAEIVRERRLGPQGFRGECYADDGLIAFLAGEDCKEAAVVTVLSTDGSTPREAGAKMAVFPDGRTACSIGGGCAEADAVRDAIDVIRTGGFRLKIIDMTGSAEDDGMVCGGRMEVLIEAF
jgi:xanthine dehydrogenase accessory factor